MADVPTFASTPRAIVAASVAAFFSGLTAASGFCQGFSSPFFQPMPIPVPPYLDHGQAADMNGDGTADILMAIGTNLATIPPTAQTYVQAPAGIYTPLTPAPLINDISLRYAVGDFTGDGTLDIVFASQGYWCVPGVGDGTFGAPFASNQPGVYGGVDAADLDANGTLDVVNGAMPPAIGLNNGFGAFSYALGQIPDPAITCPFGWLPAVQPLDQTLTDGDQDGLPDLVRVFVTTCTPNTNQTLRAEVLRNTGGATFVAGPLTSIQNGDPPSDYSVAFADFTGDGVKDVVVAWSLFGFGGIPVSAVRSYALTPALTLSTTGTCTLASLGGVATSGRMALVDTNTDGRSETIFVNAAQVRTSGGPPPVTSWICGIWDDSPMGAFVDGRVKSGDVDGDGLDDILVPCMDGTLRVMFRTLAPVNGVQTFGSGTPGCDGSEALVSLTTPNVGGTAVVLATKAPPSSLGLLLLSSVQDAGGSDPFGVGVSLLVNLFPPAWVSALDMPSSPYGSAMLAIPIPNDPGLQGFTAHLQALWAWSLTSCSLPPFQLSASNGLTFTVQ